MAREKLVQQLDPDASLRGSGTWETEDLHYDKALVRNLFEYVRAGELDLALDLCMQTSQPWRAASLRGAIFYHDPTLSEPSDEINGPIGNRQRSIWRRVARKAATNLALDPYERALYGALSGDLGSVLAVSHTWEERLWGHINARFEQQLELALAQATPSPRWLGAGESSVDDTAPADDLDSVFEQLAHASPSTAEEALDPYHIVQRALITHHVPDLLVRVNARLPEMEQLEDKVYARLVRFFAHFTLLYHMVAGPLPADVRAPILTAYVGVLQQASESCELVAMYASSLGEDGAHTAYADFLAALDPDVPMEDRRRALLQAQPHGLDPAAIARETVAQVVQELLPRMSVHDEPQDWNSALSLDERHIILAIDWLTFVEATFPEAVWQTNALIRVFMSTGRLHAAHSLLQRLPADLLASVADLDLGADQVQELDHWRSYFDVLGKNVAARGLWSDAALAESYAEHHDWSQALSAATETARLASMELLELGWLQLDVTEPVRQAQLLSIRQQYIPEIVLSLHWMLVDTSAVVHENLAHALALPNLIADERLRLYAEFSAPSTATSHPLRKYLEQVREASILALERGLEVPGGDPTPVVTSMAS